MRLYWELAKRQFQRQLAYRTANLAGLVTNSFFGYVRAAIFLAAFQARPEIEGYDAHAAVTYTWVTQALIMIVMMWGWWEVERTIRTGDVVSDLAKPFSYLGFWLARDYGRALYFVLFRAAPTLLIGQVTFGIRWPTMPITWVTLAASLALAVAVSFGWRFLLNLAAFWTTDARGLGNVANVAVLILSGFMVPLPFFPDWLRSVLLALPFASIIHFPADIFVERTTGTAALAALGQQALWAVVMLAAAQLLAGAATRRVVIQGG